MSNKDLQRATELLSDIGQASVHRRPLPAHRNHITQKVNFARQRTLCISVHNNARPSEVYLQVNGSACSSEWTVSFDKQSTRINEEPL